MTPSPRTKRYGMTLLLVCKHASKLFSKGKSHDRDQM